MISKISIKEWSRSAKVQARAETVIESYRQFAGRTRIPDARQYLTLAGRVGDADGSVNTACEALHVTHDALGVCTRNQFIGVDIDGDIVEENRCLLPDFDWILATMATVIRHMVADGRCRPEIINFDHHHMPEAAFADFQTILPWIPEMQEPPRLVVFNFSLTNPYDGRRDWTDEKVAKMLSKSHVYREFREDYSAARQYAYAGSGCSHKEFRTLIFTRR
jgi:hypothetical protein